MCEERSDELRRRYYGISKSNANTPVRAVAPSNFDAISNASLVAESSDKKNFGMVLGLLGAAAYFDLYASLVTGKVLTMFDSSSTEKDGGKFDWVKPIYCVVGDCSGADTNFEKKALILGYLLVMILKSFLYVTNVYIHHLACDRKNSKMKTDCFDKVLSLGERVREFHADSLRRSAVNIY